MGFPSGIECIEASSASVEALEAFLRIDFGSDLFQFLNDLGRFGDAKTEAKIEFWDVVWNFFSSTT